MTFRKSALKRALLNPRKSLRLLATGAGWRRLRYAVRPPRHGSFGITSDGVGARHYNSYDDYVRHQRSKVAMLDLSTYDVQFRRGLAQRLAGKEFAGKTVLCLAARLGTEVKAFHDLGAFAVGIDLEPGLANATVLPGDFHNLVFPDSCVDVIYCNSLDHAYDLTKTLAEARRVLKPSGLLLLDVQTGTEDAGEFDDWAATTWATTDQIAEAAASSGFSINGKQPITVPWLGAEIRCTIGENGE